MKTSWQGRPRLDCPIPLEVSSSSPGPRAAGEPGWGESLGYRARPGQARLAHDPARFKVVVAHRRFGKTVFAAIQLLRGAAEEREPAPRFAYVAPLYRQAKAVVWDYLKHYARGIDGARFHETELRCDLPNGARISLYGADDPDSLRGLYFDGVVLDTELGRIVLGDPAFADGNIAAGAILRRFDALGLSVGPRG